jgi:hypothetical protein
MKLMYKQVLLITNMYGCCILGCFCRPLPLDCNSLVLEGNMVRNVITQRL